MANNKVIIVKHQTFREITNDEVLLALNFDSSSTDISFIDVKYKIMPMEEIDMLDSGEAKAYQKEIYEKIIKPLIEQNPGSRICYFGATTIPLAVHLGYCFGSWHSIDVFLLNREANEWKWIDPLNEEGLATISRFPSELIEINSEVLYRVEASYPTQLDEIKDSIGANIQTVSLSLRENNKDAFKSPKQLEKFGYEFSQGLDAIATNIPHADKIHLIITAPVGVAFYLGTRFNPNMTRPVVLYQYNTNKNLKYEEIFVLQEDGSTLKQISEDDEKYIEEIRVRLKKELEEKVSPYANNKKEDYEKGPDIAYWVEMILPKGDYESLKTGYWKYLATIAETILTKTTLSTETREADDRDGFYIEESGEWQISNRFIFNIFQRIGKNEENVIRALRMFMFHEAFHIHQNLTNRTARVIGRFPRILEEADYVADVWTFLHEYSFSKMYYSKETEDAKVFFKSLIELAIETMWSFVELAPNNNEIQIRAVNRFLIWYWVYNLIDDRKCQSIQDIVLRLAIKPILEIKGLDIKAQAQRTIYKLNNPRLDELEIGYCSPDMKIYRQSNAAGLDIGNLVSGFKERNSKAVHNEMKTLYHIIGPQLKSFS